MSLAVFPFELLCGPFYCLLSFLSEREVEMAKSNDPVLLLGESSGRGNNCLNKS